MYSLHLLFLSVYLFLAFRFVVRFLALPVIYFPRLSSTYFLTICQECKSALLHCDSFRYVDVELFRGFAVSGSTPYCEDYMNSILLFSGPGPLFILLKLKKNTFRELDLLPSSSKNTYSAGFKRIVTPNPWIP